MNRRTFLGTLTGGLLAAPLDAAAQQAGKVFRIGVLYPGADNSIFRNNFNGFRQVLGPAGYVEGRNLTVDVRVGDGRALAPLAAELMTRHPDLIVAVARPGVLAMHTVGATIPVVALDLESDPVASRFVKTVPRPGGNITGVFMDFPELAGKWLEILKTTVPRLARVAVLWDPSTGPAQLDAASQAAQSLKLATYTVEARSTEEIEPAFRAAMRVVSYGPDVMTMYAQAGAIALKILAGTPAAEIPVERPTRFTLSFNLKTAKALGLTIPPSLLQRADQVIE